MEHARERRPCARADIGGGARNGAGGGQSAKQGRGDIRHALGDQFGIRAMTAPGHAIGDDGRQQRLDAGEKRDGQRTWQQLGGAIERDGRKVEYRQGRGQFAETRADGVDRQTEDDGHARADTERDQEARPVRMPSTQPGDYRHAEHGQGERRRLYGTDVLCVGLDAFQEFGRHLAHLEAERILDLADEDADRDAGGESRDDRLRHVLHQGAQTQQARCNQNQPGKQGAQDQAAIAEILDHHEHHRNERGRRSADLDAGPAEGGNHESGDDRRMQALFGRRAAGNGQCHRQRQGHDGHRESGDRIGTQIAQAVALAQHRQQLRLPARRIRRHTLHVRSL